jgi:S1-C subfamily serine protease
MLTRVVGTLWSSILFATIALSVVQLAKAQSVQPPPPASKDLNTALMEATCRIQGPTAAGPSMGTGFILVAPFEDSSGNGRMVLITAAHVLSSIVGDSIELIMHRKSATGWQSIPVTLPIRSNGHPTWVQHPRADVAAVYAFLPEDLTPRYGISTQLLVTDRMLSEFEIHPGDELNVLGYPLGVGNTGDFAVLRSGKIASYPLVPTSENPFFLLDFRVFRGNSGGPVYFVQAGRVYGGTMRVGLIQFVMGLVSEELSVTQQFQGLYESRSETYPLQLAKIVPAPYIIETIKLLPPANGSQVTEPPRSH